jgi:PiT family inorganic phosphate transporter
MHSQLTLLVIVVAVALCFDFINGFHDTANAIATIISTRGLSPRAAIAMATALNLVGALLGTHVATTISSDLVDAQVVSQWMVLTALLGAVTWNLATWYWGLPSSSSHALIGGVIGAVTAAGYFGSLHFETIFHKVLIPLVASPLVGMGVGFFLMTVIMWLFNDVPAPKANGLFRRLQVFSSAFLAYSHGNNDAQKSMGIITMALVAVGKIDVHHVEVPKWVILSCAAAMACGTASGGWRIIKTMGSKIFKLQPVHGFAAEISGASTIVVASHFGAPVSTTHVIAGAIMGVGATRRLSAVRWGVAGNMLVAWVLTIPAAAAVSGLLCYSGLASQAAMH